MTVLEDLLHDLSAESEDLERHVAGRSAADWRADTPAPGWSVAQQIAHLAWTDEAALIAATDPDGFQAMLHQALESGGDFVNAAAEQGAVSDPDVLLDRWRTGRLALAEALAAVEAGRKLPWFGPPMSAASMATARIMETWAHGQDIVDALGVRRTPTARLRHVAWIGVRTRDFAFISRGLPTPAAEFRVELAGPDGDRWEWGPADGAQRVTGSALDFCLLVTQRRHRLDLDVHAEGPDADRWLDIAQAFAGPAGPGRLPGQFAESPTA
jgi:uncharacterized protein (TIGR03084 family)